MRSDSKWRVISSKSQKLKSQYFWSKLFMILLACSVLPGVYLFVFYDQAVMFPKAYNNRRVSIAISQFQPVQPTSLPHVFEKDGLEKTEKSIWDILKDSDIKSATFVLAQLGAQFQKDPLYTTSRNFYTLISSVFQNDKTAFSPWESILKKENLVSATFSDRPFHRYSQSFENKNNSPQISLVLLRTDSDSADIQSSCHILPKEITLSYLPDHDQLSLSIQKARTKGHEILLMMPSKSLNDHKSDAGPDSLPTDFDPQDHLNHLDRYLQQSEGIIGVTNFIGCFVSSKTDISIFLKALSDHGLMGLEIATSLCPLVSEIAQDINVPFVHTNLQIDEVLSKEEIEAKLHGLEQQALTEGKAIGYVFFHNLTIDVITVWAKNLAGKGILLAPLSAHIRKKK